MAAITEAGVPIQLWVATVFLDHALATTWVPDWECFYEYSLRIKVWPQEITHIMPFIPPAMPE